MAVVVVVSAARVVGAVAAAGPVGVVDVTVAVTAGVAAVLSGAVLADPAADIDVLELYYQSTCK